MPNKVQYVDELGNPPTKPKNGWQSASINSKEGKELIRLFVSGEIDLVSRLDALLLPLETPDLIV